MHDSNGKNLNPSCPLCESNSTRPRARYENIEPGNWTLYQCSDCATSFIDPMPDSGTLAKYYDEDYYGRGEGKFLTPVEGIVRFFRYLRARRVHRLIPPLGRVLDVGCGRGIMLKYLKICAHEVRGLELDTVAAVRAEKNLHQEIFRTLEEPARLLAPQYEAICFWHSLEHLPEPMKALRTADRLLAPGGLLVVSAPHMGSLQSRLSGPSWLHLDLPRHLVHFDMKRLPEFFQTKRYRLIWQQHFSQEYNVIDTLCYLYAVLGFDHLYPYNLIRAGHRHGDCKRVYPLRTVLGLPLLLPLGVVAFFIANFCSLLRSGSTVTLFLRKLDRSI